MKSESDSGSCDLIFLARYIIFNMQRVEELRDRRITHFYISSAFHFARGVFVERDRMALRYMLAYYFARMYSRAQIVALRRVVHRNKSRWSWHHHGGARESQFHGARAADMTHVRYVHALRRAKAIFRSNMIIKSNGIRNCSGARILSTNPLPPLRFLLHPVPLCRSACLVVCCDPLTFSPE